MLLVRITSKYAVKNYLGGLLHLESQKHEVK